MVPKSEKGPKDGKMKALEDALAQIEKDYGKDAIMRLGERHSLNPAESIATGILPLDLAMGVGGIPRGRVIEVFGPEAGGKTTLTLCMIAQAQKNGGLAGFIDVEHALDPEYARSLGVDIDNLYISQPDSGEQAMEIVEKLTRSGSLDLIVVDSVAALVPAAEIEGEMGDAHVGLQARLMSQALRKLTPIISKAKTSVVFINQIRQKIGIMYGNNETTPAGLALKFYSSIRIDIRRIGQVKKGDEVVANQVRAKIVKNKVAPPFKIAEFEITFGQGIDRAGYLVDMAVKENVIKKSGAFFSYKNESVGQGRDKVKDYLIANPAVADEIEKVLKDSYMDKTRGSNPAKPVLAESTAEKDVEEAVSAEA